MTYLKFAEWLYEAACVATEEGPPWGRLDPTERDRWLHMAKFIVGNHPEIFQPIIINHLEPGTLSGNAGALGGLRHLER